VHAREQTLAPSSACRGSLCFGRPPYRQHRWCQKRRNRSAWRARIGKQNQHRRPTEKSTPKVFAPAPERGYNVPLRGSSPGRALVCWPGERPGC
jgi:hypothetical protein